MLADRDQESQTIIMSGQYFGVIWCKTGPIVLYGKVRSHRQARTRSAAFTKDRIGLRSLCRIAEHYLVAEKGDKYD